MTTDELSPTPDQEASLDLLATIPAPALCPCGCGLEDDLCEDGQLVLLVEHFTA